MAERRGRRVSFLGPGIGEIGKARARDEMRLGHETLDRGPHRLGAEEQRFLFAARVEQTVGEDMAALGIGAELDLVDGEKRHAQVERHRLDRADEIARLGRHDLLFAGDEGGEFRALDADDLVIDLAGEEPERQADHARAMGEHALDREMGLAGVGRSQDRGDPAAVGGAGSAAGRSPRVHSFATWWF